SRWGALVGKEPHVVCRDQSVREIWSPITIQETAHELTRTHDDHANLRAANGCSRPDAGDGRSGGVRYDILIRNRHHRKTYVMEEDRRHDSPKHHSLESSVRPLRGRCNQTRPEPAQTGGCPYERFRTKIDN